MLTLDSMIYFRIIDPASGSVNVSKTYSVDSSATLYLPQMATSERYQTLYLVYRVEKLNGSLSNPPNYQQIVMNFFNISDLEITSETFAFSELATPYSIDILQKSNEEQLFIKGLLDTGSDTYDQMFTISMYPLMHTQDFGNCSATLSLSVSSSSGDPTHISESSLSGLLNDTTTIAMNLNSSGLTYVSSPTSLTTSSI